MGGVIVMHDFLRYGPRPKGLFVVPASGPRARLVPTVRSTLVWSTSPFPMSPGTKDASCMHGSCGVSFWPAP